MATIGVQAMMLRSQVDAVGVYPAFARLVTAGFHVVEISQIALTADALAELVRARDELGLRIAAISGTMDERGGANDSLVADLGKVVADARALGTDRVRIGMLPLTALESLGGLVAFGRAAEEKAKALADEGIRLSYHNHHFEFARVGGRRLLDIIRAEAPTLRFEIDVHWVQRGGGDPVAVLDEYAGVVDLVHLKDYRIGIPGPEAFEALRKGDHATWQRHVDGLVQFAEVGAGSLDFARIIDVALAAGAQHLLIEQDDTYGRDVFDSLADSRWALVELGYENLIAEAE